MSQNITLHERLLFSATLDWHHKILKKTWLEDDKVRDFCLSLQTGRVWPCSRPCSCFTFDPQTGGICIHWRQHRTSPWNWIRCRARRLGFDRVATQLELNVVIVRSALPLMWEVSVPWPWRRCCCHGDPSLQDGGELVEVSVREVLSFPEIQNHSGRTRLSRKVVEIPAGQVRGNTI